MSRPLSFHNRVRLLTPVLRSQGTSQYYIVIFHIELLNYEIKLLDYEMTKLLNAQVTKVPSYRITELSGH